jgi:hypothetical protein
LTHLFHFDYYELPAPVDAVCPPPRADRFRSPVVRRRHFRWSGRGGAKLTHRPLTLSADVPTKTHSPRGASSAVSSKAKILARSHASAGASSIAGYQGAGQKCWSLHVGPQIPGLPAEGLLPRGPPTLNAAAEVQHNAQVYLPKVGRGVGQWTYQALRRHSCGTSAAP